MMDWETLRRVVGFREERMMERVRAKGKIRVVERKLGSA
jgi:hypothetical protein